MAFDLAAPIVVQLCGRAMLANQRVDQSRQRINHLFERHRAGAQKVNGMACASVMRWRLLPSLTRPIGWAPVHGPRRLATLAASMRARLTSDLPASRNSPNGSRCR